MKKSSEQFSAFHEQKGPNNVQIKSLFHHSQTEEEDFSTPLPFTLWTQYVYWTWIRHSEDIKEYFWTSYEHSI